MLRLVNQPQKWGVHGSGTNAAMLEVVEAFRGAIARHIPCPYGARRDEAKELGRCRKILQDFGSVTFSLNRD